MKKIVFAFFTIVILAGVGVAVYFLRNESLAPDDSFAAAYTTKRYTIEQTRSVTYYKNTSLSATYDSLKVDIASIRNSGFNTIWIVVPWRELDPKPLEKKRSYNEANFKILLQILDLADKNQMNVILPLNYLGSGWAPEGINACNWVREKSNYAAFEQYTSYYLKKIEKYSSIVKILVFTEGAEPCGMTDESHAVEVASILRGTLGSLPSRLDQKLRAKFLVGYHDWSLVNLGWAKGQSPVKDPKMFDFVSMSAYSFENKSQAQVNQELNKRIARFQKVFPSKPILLGETGVSFCFNGGTVANQTKVGGYIAKYAVSNNMGVNWWGWAENKGECSNQVLGGLAINDSNKKPRPVLKVLTQEFTPKITSSGINYNYQPWAVWIKGYNLNPNLTITLYDNNTLWKSDIPIVYSSDFISFQLPSNLTPSKSNSKQNAVIKFELYDPTTHLRSKRQSLTIKKTGK